MIEFLQVFESLLFLAIAYRVIKLSPLLENAAFINGQNLEPKEVEVVAQSKAVKMSLTVRNFAPMSHSNLHHTGIALAH